MFKIGFYSAKLFFQGKLFRDPAYIARQTLIGVSIGFFVLVLLTLLKLPLAFVIAGSSIVTGAVMPWLLKDLRMK
jgi:hypothetical protein